MPLRFLHLDYLCDLHVTPRRHHSASALIARRYDCIAGTRGTVQILRAGAEQIAKRLAASAPQAIQCLLLRERPDGATAARFVRLTRFIRRRLYDEGKLGCRHASFASQGYGQVAREGSVIADVKIAQDATEAKGLSENNLYTLAKP